MLLCLPQEVCSSDKSGLCKFKVRKDFKVTTMDIFSILTLAGGLALFLYGMNVMGDSLKKLSGGKLETILAQLTSNKFKGFLLGFMVTGVIQSSSATTVMLVGFVNSGIMQFSQVFSIILGANVGTTVTAWLLSLSDIGDSSYFLLKLFKPSSFTPVLAVIGVVMSMTAKTDKKNNIAYILIGFAVLMFGMETMSGAMEGLKDDPKFAEIMVMFQNPVLGILSGLILTAIIQSSSASVGILQALALAGTGAISYSTAIPIILGQNIGTTITPVLSALNGNSDSKRVAVTCVNIKFIGVIIVSSVFYIINSIHPFSFMDKPITAMEIAIVHTLFNIIATIILIPFDKPIEKLAYVMIKTKQDAEQVEDHKDIERLHTLDDRFISVPSFAIEKAREVTHRMAEITQKGVVKATIILRDYDPSKEKRVLVYEDMVDKYEDKIGSYLVSLAATQLNTEDSHQVTKLLHVIGDIERISDHAVNIARTAKELNAKKLQFPEHVHKELNTLTSAVREILNITTDMLAEDDLSLAKHVEPLEQIIDKIKSRIRKNYIQRMQEGEGTFEMGFILSDLLTNYERIADHCSNIAVAVLGNANNLFESHDYLNHIKEEGENDFFENYEHYKAKYLNA